MDKEVKQAIIGLNWDEPVELFFVREQASDNKIIATVGNWWISIHGDLYFGNIDETYNDESGKIYQFPIYAIFSYQLAKNDWVLHLLNKNWFDVSAFYDFRRAYSIACKIAGIKPVRQIKQYT